MTDPAGWATAEVMRRKEERGNVYRFPESETVLSAYFGHYRRQLNQSRDYLSIHIYNMIYNIVYIMCIMHII